MGFVMTIAEKSEHIICDIKRETGVNPIKIFKNIAKNDYVSIHGPEQCVVIGVFVALLLRLELLSHA